LKRSLAGAKICHPHSSDDRHQRISISIVSQQNSLANR